MLINVKVKTLDALTYDFKIDNETTIREFKNQIAEKTHIAACQQRIIYCGRVLADDKKLKEFDVDGKVLHVAERPPPSPRDASTSSSSAPQNEQNQAGSAAGDMRNSPLFRALDGMVLGTMSIPMNAPNNNAQMPNNPFASSSSFCVNRITVARHMLECANNIAAYLENPERGLNNTPLDILARGRWTMESTVVEVGISANPLPPNQNIVEMVQVFGSSDGDTGSAPETIDVSVSAGDGVPSAAVIIEDVIDLDDDGNTTDASSNAAQAGSIASSNSIGPTLFERIFNQGQNAATTTGGDDIPVRRRTGTTVLAEVIDQMRNVQARLQPFIDEFYELLQHEPTFDEDNTTRRENSQRLFDRVSEAIHYMAHAQHAVSDLRLDLSQPAPRYLTCRPILVEQSGYVSTNNYLSAAAAAAAAAAAVRQQQQYQHQQNPQRVRVQQQVRVQQVRPPQTGHTHTGTTTSPPANTAASSTVTTESTNVASNSRNSRRANTATVEDPSDDPMASPNANPATPNVTHANHHQMQMARFIQAMVNSAPVDTEFHVQINGPSIVSFGMPLNAPPASRNASTQSASGASSPGSSNASNASATVTTSPRAPTTSTPTSASQSANQARVNTATLPTTSTQTRSTSRPQLQIGNMPANDRFISTGMIASFDRFLPCNSHHIREPENTANNAENTGATPPNATDARRPTQSNDSARAAATDNVVAPTSTSSTGTTTAVINIGPFMTDASTSTNAPRTQTNVNQDNNSSQPNFRNISDVLEYLRPRGGSNTDPTHPMNAPSTSASLLALQSYIRTLTPRNTGRPIEPATDTYRRHLRAQLLDVVSENLFDRQPITQRSIPSAVSRAVDMFDEALIFLPQYELPDYNSRESVFNVLRDAFPPLILLLNDDSNSPMEFEQQLMQIFDQFLKRLYSILYVCIGPINAELYWSQLMRLLLVSAHSYLSDEALHFMRIYINPDDVPNNMDTNDAQQFIAYGATSRNFRHPSPHDVLSEGDLFSEATFQLPNMDTDDEEDILEFTFSGVGEPTLIPLEVITEIETDIQPSPVNSIVSDTEAEGDKEANADKQDENSALKDIGEGMQLDETKVNKTATVTTESGTGAEGDATKGNEAEKDRTEGVTAEAEVAAAEAEAEGRAAEGVTTEAEGSAAKEVAAEAGAVAEGAVAEGAVAEGAVAEGAVEEGAVAQGVEAEEVAAAKGDATDIKIDIIDEDEVSTSSATALELPNVVIGSEPWHEHFPNDWVPVITHDVRSQTENEPHQRAFSDAYISGMSAKRRKLIQNNKPPADLKSLVAENVRAAIESTGVNDSTASNEPQTIDDITSAIVNDPAVISSYTEAVRSNVRERLKQDCDFDSEKFPQIKKFTEK